MKVKITVSVLNEQDEVERETVKEYRLEGITAERVVVVVATLKILIAWALLYAMFYLIYIN